MVFIWTEAKQRAHHMARAAARHGAAGDTVWHARHGQRTAWHAWARPGPGPPGRPARQSGRGWRGGGVVAGVASHSHEEPG